MIQSQFDYTALLRPETVLEAQLLETAAFRQGLDWGKPRFGHPEGKVGLHVREVLDNVEQLATDPASREKLRLITLAHDTFKYKEFELGKRVKHHGLLAREFMEGFTEDACLLDVIELHDEAFYCWRCGHLEHQPEAAAQRLTKLLMKLGDNLPLYFDFYRCDTRTGDKIQAPLYWFEQTVMSLLK
jgi:hypothetical protein